MNNIAINTKHSWIIDIIGLMLILLIIYTLWLGHYPLFTPDEGRYSEVAREMVITHDYITPKLNSVTFLDKPILYYWLQAFAIYLFGIKEWALRLFPALFGLLGCLMTYICGRTLLGRQTGLYAACILATSPLYFGCAHYVDLDLEIAVLISCTLLCFITAVGSDLIRKNFLFLAYVFAAFAFLSKGLIGIVFPLMIIGLWILSLNQWQLLKRIELFGGISVFLVIALPWYLLVQQANPHFFHFFFINQHFTRFLSAADFNNKTPFWFYIPIVLVGFFPWTIFLAQACFQATYSIWLKRSLYKIECFLLLWVTIIFLFFSIPHSKLIGYILPIFPALSLLTGHYLSQYQTKYGLYVSKIAFIIFALILVIVLLLASNYHWVPFSPLFSRYLYIMSSLLLLMVIAAVALLKRSTTLTILLVFALGNIAFLLTLVSGAMHLNQNSIKPLIPVLLNQKKSRDKIITYFQYYYDLSPYLGEYVTVVANWKDPNIEQRDNWVRELWYGLQPQPNNAYFIDETAFWQQWHSSQRLFVFLNCNYLAQFKRHVKQVYMLGQNNHIILLSNQPS